MKPKRQKFPIGISNFKEVVEQHYFYVDKSLLIQEVLEESAKVMLIPRPRRFGKTLNMHMLKAFFEKSEESQAGLFEGLAINQHADCMAEQGQYPVIYLTFKDVKFTSWEECYEALTYEIADEYHRHQAIFSHLNSVQQQKYEKITSLEASPVMFQRSLKTLMELLHTASGKPVVILIDEYDVPIHSAFYHGYYQEAVGFIRNFLSGGLKDNSYLHKAVLTGILRVAKESIFSGLNNLKVLSILHNSCSDKFGLTELEVKQALEQFDLSDQQLEVERWYNGYGFGNHKIYNPWSIIYYLDDRATGPYWINTSDNQVIKDLVEGGDVEVQKDLAGLLNGEVITTPLNDHVVYSEIEKNRDSVWNFLTFLGYLSIEKFHEINRKRYYSVKIPNLEVLTFYEETLLNWFDQFKVNSSLDRMLSALTEGNISQFGKELQTILETVMSYHDLETRGGTKRKATARKTLPTEPEKIYHVFVLGLLMRLETRYQIDSNRESGTGRYDIMLMPRDKTEKGLVLEFKRIEKESQSKEALEDALIQIKTKDYAQRLRSHGFHDNLGIALVFCDKQVWVEHCPL